LLLSIQTPAGSLPGLGITLERTKMRHYFNKLPLRRDTLWNIAGMGLPLLAAAVSIPLTLGHLGSEAFGVLTLILALTGYFGLFDMGMVRALTFQISKLRVNGEEDRIGRTLSAGLFVTLLAGLAGGIALLLTAHPLSTQWLKISPALQEDAQLVNCN
jgi:O-antigen/teichoic acid export membrane protein